ncbi:MAG TPA: T6SS amidase immunity protein Tai4 family protein [Polyangiales bacterium]
MRATLVLAFACIACAAQAQKKSDPEPYPRTRYSEEVTFKNWVLAQCIFFGTKGAAKKAAAAATQEYLEQGNLEADVYLKVTPLIHSFLARKYVHIYSADLVFMKCIDLFHSPELAKFYADHKDDPGR